MTERSASTQFVFVGGMLVGRRMCRRFTEAFERYIGRQIQLFTYYDALRNRQQFGEACDNSVVIAHSAGSVLLDKFKIRPAQLIAVDPPDGSGFAGLSVRLLSREAMRVFRSDSVLRGWYFFSLDQLRTLVWLPGYNLELQFQNFESWRVIVTEEDRLFRTKQYPDTLHRSKNFIIIPGHHESLYFEPQPLLKQVRELTHVDLNV